MNRLIVIGDIHGCFEQLYQLFEHEVKLNKGDRIVLVGDYIDRGPDSKAVLDYLMHLSAEGFDIVPLMGNHEDMMIRAWDSPLDTLGWMVNGGEKTLASFGVDNVRDIDVRYIEFIRSLSKYYEFRDLLVVHGGFNDDIEDPFTDEHSMLWERRVSYSSPLFSNKIIVHGHSPYKLTDLEKSLLSGSNVLNIDTGCVYGPGSGLGYLTAIDIYKRRLFSVANG